MNNSGNVSRRRFLKKLTGAALLCTAGTRTLHGEATKYSKLVDSSKCIGCRRCTSMCKQWNDLPVGHLKQLHGQTFTAVNFQNLVNKGEEGAFVKWQCQHCKTPSCARVCPATAITKLPEGAVKVDETKCIGCLYCFQACPFHIPRFDYDKRVMRKCHLCFNRFTEYPYNGKLFDKVSKPVCVMNCPVKALDFGETDKMLAKAKSRVKRTGGYLHGIEEAGGLDVITILPAPPERIGMIAAKKQKVLDAKNSLKITSVGLAFYVIIGGLFYMFSPGNGNGGSHEE